MVPLLSADHPTGTVAQPLASSSMTINKRLSTTSTHIAHDQQDRQLGVARPQERCSSIPRSLDHREPCRQPPTARLQDMNLRSAHGLAPMILESASPRSHPAAAHQDADGLIEHRPLTTRVIAPGSSGLCRGAAGVDAVDELPGLDFEALGGLVMSAHQ
jgi:hypothetical protein